jgi:hypothetical protein
MEELAVSEGLQAVGDGPAVPVTRGVGVSVPGVNDTIAAVSDAGPEPGRLQPAVRERMSRAVKNVWFLFILFSRSAVLMMVVHIIIMK